MAIQIRRPGVETGDERAGAQSRYRLWRDNVFRGMRLHVWLITASGLYLAACASDAQPVGVPGVRTASNPRGWTAHIVRDEPTSDALQIHGIHIKPLEDEYAAPTATEACVCPEREAAEASEDSDGDCGPSQHQCLSCTSLFAASCVVFALGGLSGCFVGAWLTDAIDLNELRQGLVGGDLVPARLRAVVASAGEPAPNETELASSLPQSAANIQSEAAACDSEAVAGVPRSDSRSSAGDSAAGGPDAENVSPETSVINVAEQDSTLSSSTAARPLACTAASMLSPDEVVELRAAGEMVRQMTEALGLRVAELPPAEQVHIMHSVLTAWQTRVARQQGLARIKCVVNGWLVMMVSSYRCTSGVKSRAPSHPIIHPCAGFRQRRMRSRRARWALPRPRPSAAPSGMRART